MDVPLWAWIVFACLVAAMLAVDLFGHRHAHIVGFREAADWSAVWVGVAVLFAFAAVLVYSGVKLLRDDDESYDPGSSIAVRVLRKVMRVRDEYVGTRFFVREAGRLVATPLLAVVVAIEAADVVFAVDSVPAVLAVSDDAFIVYSSNAFAILGLRALYFLLAGMLDRFHYLGAGLAVILIFIGAKLALAAAHELIHPAIPELPSAASLGVIVVVLAAAIIASLRRT